MGGRSGSWRVRALAGTAVVGLHALLIGPLLLQPPPGTWAPLLKDAHIAARFRLAQTPVVDTSIWMPEAVDSPRRDRMSVPEPDLAKVSLQSIRDEVAVSELLPVDADPLPATPPPAMAISGQTLLRCEVHVHQGSRGQVQAIDFGECNGDAVWQRSLIAALQHAAELASPTSDGVFKPVRTFIFTTDAISAEVLAKQLSVAEPKKD